MIGYSCKYAPVELIQAFGGEARLLDAEAADFSAADACQPLLSRQSADPAGTG